MHVPSDYPFWSASAFASNNIITGEGEIYVKSVKGSETGHRDFTIEAGTPMSADSHPKMTIEDVDGIIYASAWGPLTISGCRAVSIAAGAGSGDPVDIALGTVAISEKAYLSSCGAMTIRLDHESDFTF